MTSCLNFPYLPDWETELKKLNRPRLLLPQISRLFLEKNWYLNRKKC